MTLDDMLTALADDTEVPTAAIAAALEQWDEVAPPLRALLRGYVDGSDLSERTERAMGAVAHLFGEQADTASFPDLCRLSASPDRLASVFEEEGALTSYPAILVATFDGDPAPLHQLVESTTAGESSRCDALLTIAFLTGQDRIADRQTYDYLAGLPSRLDSPAGSELWWSIARSVAALGFAGLSAAVEGLFDRQLISLNDYDKAQYWRDLRHTLGNGRDFADEFWGDFQPFSSAAGHLQSLQDLLESADRPLAPGYPPLAPVRNELRDVGRNDPCPCGSGKKYKKCCLQAGAA